MNIYDLTTPGEIISYGVVVTIQGVLVVFLILILIMLVIYAMSLFSGEKKPKKVAEQVPVKVDAPVAAEETVDEGELIAVLTAAVAACMGTSSSSVNIRSYKKVSSAWGNAAKREVLDNRF